MTPFFFNFFKYLFIKFKIYLNHIIFCNRNQSNINEFIQSFYNHHLQIFLLLYFSSLVMIHYYQFVHNHIIYTSQFRQSLAEFTIQKSKISFGLFRYYHLRGHLFSLFSIFFVLLLKMDNQKLNSF